MLKKIKLVRSRIKNGLSVTYKNRLKKLLIKNRLKKLIVKNWLKVLIKVELMCLRIKTPSMSAIPTVTERCSAFITTSSLQLCILCFPTFTFTAFE